MLSASKSLLSGAADSIKAGQAKDKWTRVKNYEFAAQKRAEFSMDGMGVLDY